MAYGLYEYAGCMRVSYVSYKMYRIRRKRTEIHTSTVGTSKSMQKFASASSSATVPYRGGRGGDDRDDVRYVTVQQSTVKCGMVRYE